ncbi:MAG: DUF6498-containing protein [Planctomycetota bacterium]|jgi:hypothetical protein
MEFSKKKWLNLPVIALIGANIIPVWGVLYLDWDAFYIVLLYWAENLVVGFYNILKMAMVSKNGVIVNISKIFPIVFFMFHYGMFTAVHGGFVLTFFQKTEHANIMGRESWPCFFAFLQILFDVIRNVYLIIPANMKYAVLALFVSHGISFGYNYIYKKEYITARIETLMAQPYGRVVVMHIAIILGAFLTEYMGSPIAVLLVLVVLKIIIDVKFHLKEHKKNKKA